MFLLINSFAGLYGIPRKNEHEGSKVAIQEESLNARKSSSFIISKWSTDMHLFSILAFTPPILLNWLTWVFPFNPIFWPASKIFIVSSTLKYPFSQNTSM